MRLTVITAVRNAVSGAGLDALEKCVASIASLDVDHEHLIQDGCSTDGTTDALTELARRHPGVEVRTEPDTGIYNALNRGVERARGDWVYVLGADDRVVSPETLKAALAAGERAGASIVASPVWSSEDFSTQVEISRDDVFSSMPYPHQGLLMRLDCLRRHHGFDERYRISADADLLWRALFAGEKVLLYDEPYAYYRLGGFSTGHANLMDEVRAILQARHGLTDAEVRRLVTRKLLPPRVIFRFLVHCSRQVRASARYHLARAIADSLGLISPNGVLKLRRPRER